MFCILYTRMLTIYSRYHCLTMFENFHKRILQEFFRHFFRFFRWRKSYCDTRLTLCLVMLSITKKIKLKSFVYNFHNTMLIVISVKIMYYLKKNIPYEIFTIKVYLFNCAIIIFFIIRFLSPTVPIWLYRCNPQQEFTASYLML